MSAISELFYKAAEKICATFHIIKIYENGTGLKNINMCSVSNIGKTDALEHFELDCNKLFLGPDFLKDKYTLLDCPVSQSPHRHFMAALYNKENLYETDYIKRFIKGTIDWRRPYRVNDVSYWENRFTRIYPTVADGSYAPVLVYQKNAKYYIYDGKHRAALCAMIGKKVKCDLIPENCVTGFYGKYFFDLLKTKKGYEKHIAFINEQTS